MAGEGGGGGTETVEYTAENRVGTLFVVFLVGVGVAMGGGGGGCAGQSAEGEQQRLGEHFERVQIVMSVDVLPGGSVTQRECGVEGQSTRQRQRQRQTGVQLDQPIAGKL